MFLETNSVFISTASHCPKCDSMFVDESQVTRCPLVICRHTFCRLCTQAPHNGKTCQEAKAEDEIASATAKAAEAMSNAVLRRCPGKGCGKPFLKEEGPSCNRMTCPNCGVFSCYVCRQTLSKGNTYDHFCRTPHCNHSFCGKCVLYTDTKEEHRVARREAGLQELQNAGDAAEHVGLLLLPPGSDILSAHRHQLRHVRRAPGHGDHQAAAAPAITPLRGGPRPVQQVYGTPPHRIRQDAAPPIAPLRGGSRPLQQVNVTPPRRIRQAPADAPTPLNRRDPDHPLQQVGAADPPAPIPDVGFVRTLLMLVLLIKIRDVLSSLGWLAP
jgi:hypothetical protein